MSTSIVDVCCGSRMFYFDKQNPQITFCDIRHVDEQLCDGRWLHVHPDIQCDFRDLPFETGSKHIVIFDPPHLLKAGEKSWLALKYGLLGNDWREDLRKGFAECKRVLEPGNNRLLYFKWNEEQIPLSEIWPLTDMKPLIGDRSKHKAKTVSILFLRD